jgi:hypothetical protein
MTDQFVTRYVVTHIGQYGMRTLAEGAQGRWTYATLDEAQRHIDDMMSNNSMDTLKSLFGLPLQAMPCKCWPGHFDPIGIYPGTQYFPGRDSMVWATEQEAIEALLSIGVTRFQRADCSWFDVSAPGNVGIGPIGGR